MGIRLTIRPANGAAKPAQGQVQRGNTCRQPGGEPPAVLFMASDAL
jgi:hypothetical protein